MEAVTVNTLSVFPLLLLGLTTYTVKIALEWKHVSAQLYDKIIVTGPNPKGLCLLLTPTDFSEHVSWVKAQGLDGLLEPFCCLYVLK